MSRSLRGAGALACGGLLAVLLAAPCRAQRMVTQTFPHTGEVFKRLLADPREAQSTLRYYRCDGLNLADVALGRSWGLARWERPVSESHWVRQLNVEGMAYSRFKLAGGVNEFETIDFFANVPFTFRKDEFSGRAMLFHESSHLGDDYIRRTGSTGFRYSVEGFRLTLSYEPHVYLRLYTGGTALIHTVPRGQAGAVQAGFEVRSPDLGWTPGHECWAYLAQDLQWHGRSWWNMKSKTNFGLRIGVPRIVRAMRVHAGYFAGRSEFGQFYQATEHHWDLGVSFDF